jgi:hypothetical protein
MLEGGVESYFGHQNVKSYAFMPLHALTVKSHRAHPVTVPFSLSSSTFKLLLLLLLLLLL